MLRPSPNDETLWLPNDDDDDGCRNPPNVPTCSGQQLYAFPLSQNIPMLNVMQNIRVLIIFDVFCLCISVKKTSSFNPPLLTFVWNLNVHSWRQHLCIGRGPVAMLYVAISARFDDE